MPASRMATMHRFHRLFDLDVAADLFRQEVAGVGDADAQPFLGRAAVRGVGSDAAREHGQVRRQHPFGAARHDEGDLVLDRARRQSEMRRKRIA